MRQKENEQNTGQVPQAAPVVQRRVDPADIAVPPGYKVEVFAQGLTTPINIMFTGNGELLIGDAGITSGSGKVYRLSSNGMELLAEGFNPPLTGINMYRGDIYVSHRGYITAVKPTGEKVDILEGLPSWGDHHNNRVVFGPDGKMYFGQGTATNSGVVGEDNKEWVEKYPFFHDYAGAPVALRGQNFASDNFLTVAPGDMAYTGAYAPFNVSNVPGELAKPDIRASGSILRANPDGSELELVAWGLRNPFRILFDRSNRLFVENHGMDVRGSRPVDNSPDEFRLVEPGAWYGWPDYTGGLPVTLPMFRAEGKPQPEFLLAQHPMVPPAPIANSMPHAAWMGFDFNYNPQFGPVGDAYIAEFGSEAPETTGGKPLPQVGHRVVGIDMNTGQISNFAVNRSGLPASMTGGGGFERPIDVVFGPYGYMYVADFGMAMEEEKYIPGTGVIWRIGRAG